MADSVPTTRNAFRNASLDLVDRMIKSGDFNVLFSCLKGFRNGLVYGTRVRAPHALVLNLVWSKAPYSAMPRKIFDVTRMHALGLGYSAVTFATVRGILQRLRGTASPLHDALAGFLIGFLFWGDSSCGVHIQMMMYMLARVVCALYHLAFSQVKLPSYAYRVYMGILWALTLTLLSVSPSSLQASMKQSLEYIFYDSSKFSSWYDVFIMNTANTL